jgi:hypothetical protein
MQLSDIITDHRFKLGDCESTFSERAMSEMQSHDHRDTVHALACRQSPHSPVSHKDIPENSIRIFLSPPREHIRNKQLQSNLSSVGLRIPFVRKVVIKVMTNMYAILLRREQINKNIVPAVLSCAECLWAHNTRQVCKPQGAAKNS